MMKTEYSPLARPRLRLARKTSKLLLVAGLCAPFPLQALAASVEDANQSNSETAIRLDTLTVQGNKLYEAESSEEAGGYTSDAATVGTKTPAALRDIPQSITILTNEYIQDREFVNLDDLAKYTPGLRTLTNDSGRSSIYSRGYEYNESNIDGLPAPMSSIFGTLPSLAAFDRVEIMRGPSGLFNSTSEMGGIINLVRKRATRDFQGHITGRYGSWDTHMEEVDLSGPLNDSGSVRGRVVLNNSQTNGEVDNNDRKDQTIYGDLDIDLDDATTLSIGLLHQKRDQSPTNGLPAYSDGSLLDVSNTSSVGADWNYFSGTMTDLFAELTHQFDNGGYGRIAARASDRDADFKYAYGKSAINDEGAFQEVWMARDFEQNTYSIDASYSQPFQTFGNVSEFVVGADMKHYDTYYTHGSGSFGYVSFANFDASELEEPETTYSQGTSSKEKAVGIYSKLTFRPIESLALIAGARLSKYSIESYTTTFASNTTKGGEQHLTGRVTPYAGAVFDLNDNYSLYASYSEVYDPQTDLNEAGDLIDPRVGKQYEVGIKGSHFGGQLNSRLSLFQMTDENRATTDLSNTSYSIASGKTRVTGGEIELSGQLTPNWEILAGYTYMDTDNLDGDANTTFYSMPQNEISLWNKYSFHGGVLNGFSVGAGVTGMSNFYSIKGGTRIDAPGYATVDAKLAYQITPKLKATLDFTNLMNRKYYRRVGSTGTFNFYGEGRKVMAGLSYDL